MVLMCSQVLIQVHFYLISRNLQWTSLETRRPVYSSEDKEILFYPGGGFTNQLYKLWYVLLLISNLWINTILIFWIFGIFDSEELDIPMITLLIFCSEGDNMGGVLLVANELNRWLKVMSTTAADNDTPRWKFPISWKLFFGNPPPMTIY